MVSKDWAKASVTEAVNLKGRNIWRRRMDRKIHISTRRDGEGDFPVDKEDRCLEEVGEAEEPVDMKMTWW